MMLTDGMFDALRALVAELEAARDATERQYFDGIEVGMTVATPTAADYDQLRARIAYLERKTAQLYAQVDDMNKKDVEND